MVKNFCIFAEGQKAEWHYGDLTDEFIENTVSFLNGLDGMGKELFGSGVASIELDVSKIQDVAISTTEIFVVSLFSQFFLIASDPLTTIKLIENTGGIPSEVEDVIRGVLGGQATVLYSNLFMEAETKEAQNQVDELFRSTMRGMGIVENLDSIVDQGRISFASFSFSEMLIFHYLLRKIFSQKFTKSSSWAIVADDSGSPIHLSFGEVENTTSLAGYLSVLSLFCRELFDAPPKSLVFGGDSLIPLEMVNGDSTFCAFAAWDLLFNHPDFLKQLEEINQTAKEDIISPLSGFMAENLSLIFRDKLKAWNLPRLIHIFRNLEESIAQLSQTQ
ncbi:MAG: hypothetical protein ACXAC7_21405 [Candidatus Hodarchaeales archaeon]|jgi:hypothetical protein